MTTEGVISDTWNIQYSRMTQNNQLINAVMRSSSLIAKEILAAQRIPDTLDLCNIRMFIYYILAFISK